MDRKLPPFGGLRCFEMAAKYESFVLAADILHLTPSAVSHQVKALESFLDRTLFVRTPRGVCLTEEGRAYARRIGAAFDLLQEATHDLRLAQEVETLTVRVPPSLAHLWLMPRLAGFMAQAPDVRIRLLTDPGAEGRPDCEIRYGHGKWPNMAAELLWTETLYPLAAPELANRVPTPAHLQASHTLVHTQSRAHGWQDLFDMRRVSCPQGRVLPFDRTSLALEAARNGLGIALESELLARPLLEGGELTTLWSDMGIPDEAYYFVTAAGAHGGNIARFRNWLIDSLPALR